MEQGDDFVFSSTDQFQIDESLGKGAFGQVFRIRSKSLSKQYAMKRIEFDGITQAMRRMALCEGYFLKQLQHEHIVSFHGCFSSGGIGYLVMELFAAGTMKKLIKQRRGMHFLEVEIAKWMGQFATALKYCHFKHVIHRDLKSEHLYVDALGQLKLGGFGFARSEDVKTDEREELIGTPTHMAPELWLDVVGSNHAYNRLTDIWAYGVCCYEIANLALPVSSLNFEISTCIFFFILPNKH